MSFNATTSTTRINESIESSKFELKHKTEQHFEDRFNIFHWLFSPCQKQSASIEIPTYNEIYRFTKKGHSLIRQYSQTEHVISIVTSIVWSNM